MIRPSRTAVLAAAAFWLWGCATAYQSKPLPFKPPEAHANATDVAGVRIGAQAYSDPQTAAETFGFDVIGAGMLPVMVVLDNQSGQPVHIHADQSFLEDAAGNLWPVLSRQNAQERAARFSKTREIFKEGAYAGFLGAAAGGLVGAAIGIVSGENVAVAAGKGAAMGAAAGAVLGGTRGYGQDRTGRDVQADMEARSIENVAVEPGTLAHGLLFFPAEAGQVRQLRLQVRDVHGGRAHTARLAL
jgi:hypothetical protein